MAKLTSFVHVTDEQGRPHCFGPEDTVPGWAAEKITNPKAWTGPRPVPATVTTAGPGPGGGEGQGGGGEVKEPPRAGAGSGRDAWVAYAKAQGMTDEDLEGLSREAIVAKIDERREN